MVTVGDLIFGGTGTIGHLFRYNPATGASTDLGEAIPDRGTITTLFAGPGGYVYGAAGSYYDPAHLFRFHPVDPWAVEDLGVPPESPTKVAGLTLHSDGLIYGAGDDSNQVFSYDPATGSYATVGQISGIGDITCLTAGPDGRLYGGDYLYPSAHLWVLDPETGQGSVLGVPVPNDYEIYTVLTGPDGKIYGGTGARSGYLFSYDVDGGSFETFGAPVWWDTYLYTLLLGSDGWLYGGTAARQGRLFRFDPLVRRYQPTGASTSISIAPRMRHETFVPSTTEVWALTMASDGRVYASGWGTGNSAVLARWDPAAGGLMEFLGNVPGAPSVVYALVEGLNGKIYGGGGRSFSAPIFFSYDPATSAFAFLSVGLVEEDYVHALARCPGGLIYGGTGGTGEPDNGQLFAYDPSTGSFAFYGKALPLATSVESLVCAPDGTIYGGTGEIGHLFSFDPASGFADLGAPLVDASPITALTWGPDGWIYGGTGSGGRLFAYQSGSGSVLDLGQPYPYDSAIQGLTTTSDGLVLGVTAGIEGHLFAYDPDEGPVRDLGKLLVGERYGCGLAASADGQMVFLGTGSTLGELVIYHRDYAFAWWDLAYATNEPGGTDVTIDVLDTAGNVLLSDASSGASLLDIPVESAPALQLRASLATDDPGTTPALLEWSVTWTEETLLIVSPPQLGFFVPAAGPDPEPQTLSLTAVGAGQVTWEFSALPDWLSAEPMQGMTPATVAVTADPGTLPPGTYSDVALLSGSPGCGNCPVAVPVTMAIESPPVIQVTPDEVEVTAPLGGPSPEPVPLTVNNLGGGELVWQAEVDEPWLWPVPDSGTVDDTLWLYFDVTGLGAGPHDATLVVSDLAGLAEPVTVPVSLTIYDEPVALVTPEALTLESVQGATEPVTGSLLLRNGGPGVLTWTAWVDADWLAVAPQGGIVPPAATLVVSADPTDLTADVYTAALTISGTADCGNCPLGVPVTLAIEPPPVIEVTPPSVAVTLTMGVPNPPPVALTVANSGGGDLDWEAEVDVPWLSVDPSSGTVDTTLWLHFGVSGMGAGSYAGQVQVSDAAGLAEPVTVPVTLTRLAVWPVYLPLIRR